MANEEAEIITAFFLNQGPDIISIVGWIWLFGTSGLILGPIGLSRQISAIESVQTTTFVRWIFA